MSLEKLFQHREDLLSKFTSCWIVFHNCRKVKELLLLSPEEDDIYNKFEREIVSRIIAIMDSYNKITEKIKKNIE